MVSVWTGNLFPFLFIAIALRRGLRLPCADLSSGTTPKMLANESQACFIGYGGMLMESFVAIMAGGGLYYRSGRLLRVEQPDGGAGAGGYHRCRRLGSAGDGWALALRLIRCIKSPARSANSRLSPAGGAPTLAVGMAYILHGSLGGLMDVLFWYHFAILFEALFILTAVDAAPRGALYAAGSMLGVISPGLKNQLATGQPVKTALCVLAWATSCIRVVDPLGGINLWPLFGITRCWRG